MFPWRDLNPSYRTPWVTWGVLLLCVLVFVFQVVQPPMVQRLIMQDFALVPARLTAMLNEGFELGTLATVVASMFMHGGLLHLLGNLMFLRVFGDNVEDHFGHGRYVAFYLLTGAAAAVTQWAIDPFSTVPMVGASGAIAGVMAAYLLLYPRARVETVVPLVIFFPIVELPAFVLIALWFAMQLFSGVLSLGMPTGAGGIAFWAHIGGFAAGLLLTAVMRRPRAVPAMGYYDPRHSPRDGGYYG